jgi:glycosyltransferase involved in cell wall biosynthesis
MLARAIRSVLNQTFRGLRVFVTDNASGDETKDVVRRIQEQDNRVIYHCQPENLGMNANFYYGMSQVETPFYSLLSDDDVLLPKFYEIAYTEFQKYPQAMLVATNVAAVTPDGRLLTESLPLSLWDRTGLFDPPSGAHRFVAKSNLTITGIVFRREFLKTKYAYPDPQIHAVDHEVIFNAALHYPIVTINGMGALIVHHDEPRAQPDDPFSIVSYFMSLIHRIEQDNRFPSEIKAGNRQMLLSHSVHYLMTLFLRLILDGDYQGAEKALKMVTRYTGHSSATRKRHIILLLFRSIPPLRPILKALLNIINWYRINHNFGYIDSKYLKILEIN